MRRMVPVFVAALLVAAFAGSASAESTSTWHRDNYGNGHERLVCTATSGVWTCRYDTLPISQNDQGSAAGQFRGTLTPADDTWCPDWAAIVCQHATRYVVGATIYGQSATVWEELIFTDGNGLAPMYMYLVGPAAAFPAVCPWYRTWTEALANSHECFWPA